MNNTLEKSFKISWLCGLIIIFGLLLGYALGDAWTGFIVAVVVDTLIIAYAATRKE